VMPNVNYLAKVRNLDTQEKDEWLKDEKKEDKKDEKKVAEPAEKK